MDSYLRVEPAAVAYLRIYSAVQCFPSYLSKVWFQPRKSNISNFYCFQHIWTSPRFIGPGDRAQCNYFKLCVINHWRCKAVFFLCTRYFIQIFQAFLLISLHFFCIKLASISIQMKDVYLLVNSVAQEQEESAFFVKWSICCSCIVRSVKDLQSFYYRWNTALQEDCTQQDISITTRPNYFKTYIGQVLNL